MTNTPEHAAVSAEVYGATLRDGLRELAARIAAIQVLAAESADDRELINASEQLLPLHVEFADKYRTWLVRRPVGLPPFLRRPSDGMTV